MRRLFQVLLVQYLFSLSPTTGMAQIVLTPGASHQFQKTAPHEMKSEAKAPFKLRQKGFNIELFATKPGSSFLSLRGLQIQVIILPSSSWSTWKNLESFLSRTVGIQSTWNKGELVLKGKLHRYEDWLTLIKITRNSSFHFQNHLKASPDLFEQIQQDFQKELLLKKIRNLRLDFQEPWSIDVPEETSSLDEIKRLTQNWGVEIRKIKSLLELKPVIKVDIAIAEIKLDSMKKIGLQWPTSYSAKILDFSEIAFDDLLMTAHALETRGQGKILARPNLIARSGSEAEFLAGGEFPIKIKNFASQDIVWKKYGVLLKILPQADSTGKISLKIETEISQIDMARAVDGVPGLATNRVSSHFDLYESQTVALSGLIRMEKHEKTEGLPLLSRVPLLGALFSSTDYLENKSELVIFVRPQLVKSMTEGGPQ